ncbi:hypothetical protein, partial [Klebsiella pneumoniae]|uniref:hypothetical protein n=1 Tax=Klebsiella pneumoniae TaxID=573 RepID=UPI001D0EAAFB
SDNELQNIKNFLIEAHKNPLIEDKKFTNKFNKPDNITHQTEKKKTSQILGLYVRSVQVITPHQNMGNLDIMSPVKIVIRTHQ